MENGGLDSLMVMKMSKTPYSIEEIRQRIYPVAQRYGVERVFLFGSYARGDALPDSEM